MRATALVIIVSLLATPAMLHAGPPPTTVDVERARKLFFEGIEREDHGDWAGALERFHAALAIKATAPIRFHVALCLEKTARLTAARDAFERARVDAIGEGRPEVAARAKEHLDALDARIPAIELHVSPKNATVTIDGRAIAETDWNRPIRLDPGAHEVVGEAADHARFVRQVVLADFSPTPVPVAIELAPLTTPLKTGDLPVVRPSESVAPFVVGGAGVVILAGAASMYLLRGRAIRDLDAQCGDARDRCPESARTIEDRARTYNALGNVLLGAGAAVVTASIVLYVAGRSRSSTATVAPTAGGAHLTVSVAF